MTATKADREILRQYFGKGNYRITSKDYLYVRDSILKEVLFPRNKFVYFSFDYRIVVASNKEDVMKHIKQRLHPIHYNGI